MKFGRISRKHVIIISSVLVVVLLVAVPRLLALRNVEAPVVRLSPVVTTTARLDFPTRNYRFSGHLKPETMTTVVPQTSGRITSILVHENQTVSENQLVATVDDSVIKLQMEQARAAFDATSAQLQKANQAVRPEELDSAQASLAQAEQDIEIAKSNLERMKKLFEGGSVSKSKYEEAQNAVRDGETKVNNGRRQVQLMQQGARKEDIAMARAQSEASGKQLEMARLQLDYTRIRTPIAGVVAKVHADPGNMVGPGMPLVTIVSQGTIFAIVSVPEEYFGIFNNDWRTFEVQVIPLAYREREPFKGKVTRVSGVVDGSTRTFETEIAIPNQRSELKPGMYVDVKVGFTATRKTILVPSTAVLVRNRESVVFTIKREAGKPDIAVMNRVKIGMTIENETEIREGIKDGQEIISQGNAFLEDGQAVGISK